MKKLFAFVLLACVAVSISGCGSSEEKLIVGKWEAANGAKMAAEFRKDGRGCLTIMGQSIEGTYKVNGDDELEWTVDGTTQKFKVKVGAKELEFSSEGQTITYKRV
jgi:uncharacterized protein (TIGR03066 family)